jgi:hypothetical protein
MSAQIPLAKIAELRDSTPNMLALRLQEQEVCGYWKVIFSSRGVATLTKQDMTGFLSYRQNKRWREISKEDVTSDMEALRAALAVLIDESRPVAERLNELEPGRGALAVPFLGKAKLSAILLVTQPREYGVWNDYSERALRGLGVMPEFAAGAGVDAGADGHPPVARLGDQYALVNAALKKLADNNRLTMWQLDIILERIARLVR